MRAQPSPPRRKRRTDIIMPRGPRSTDASKLSFSLQMVIMISAGCLSAASVVWVSQSGLKETQAQIQSDLRNLITKMDSQKEISAAEAKARDAQLAADASLQKERVLALEKKVDMLERQMKLDDYDHKTLIKDSIAALERRK